MDEAAPGATRWEDLPQKTREHYEHAVALCTCEENQRDIDCVEHGFSRSNNYGDPVRPLAPEPWRHEPAERQ